MCSGYISNVRSLYGLQQWTNQTYVVFFRGSSFTTFETKEEETASEWLSRWLNLEDNIVDLSHNYHWRRLGTKCFLSISNMTGTISDKHIFIRFHGIYMSALIRRSYCSICRSLVLLNLLFSRSALTVKNSPDIA